MLKARRRFCTTNSSGTPTKIFLLGYETFTKNLIVVKYLSRNYHWAQTDGRRWRLIGRCNDQLTLTNKRKYTSCDLGCVRRTFRSHLWETSIPWNEKLQLAIILHRLIDSVNYFRIVSAQFNWAKINFIREHTMLIIEGSSKRKIRAVQCRRRHWRFFEIFIR